MSERDALITKWVSFVALMCAAAYDAFVLKNPVRASEFFTAGMMALGISQRLGAKVARVQADVADIRNNPTMPGTPVEDGRHGPGGPAS